jgi:hypothetical protein
MKNVKSPMLEKPCPPLDFPRNTELRDILEPIFDRLKQNEGESANPLDQSGHKCNESQAIAVSLVESCRAPRVVPVGSLVACR